MPKSIDPVPEFVDFESTPVHKAPQDLKANWQFQLPLWRPAAGEPVTEIAILTHGFLEGVERGGHQRKQARRRYDLIAKELTERGIAAVFLSLPFHFERGDDIAADGRFAPIERLRANGSYLYYGGYDQTVADIRKLVGEIRARPQTFGLDSLKKIHLVGYSLGGAAALGASANLGDELASVTALFSTWGIATINPDVIEDVFGTKYGFGRVEWESAIAELAEHKESFDKVFRDLVWGDSGGAWISSCPSRMLFIHGLSDNIFTADMTLTANLSVYENVKRMNRQLGMGSSREIVFIAPMTDHWHMRERKQVAGYVASFIANPARRG